MRIETTSGPNGSLVSEADMLAHLGLPSSDGPAIRPYLLTATELVDGDPTKSLTGASIRDRTLTLTVDLFEWEPVINLPGPPVSSVTSVDWDNDGTWTTIAASDYRLRQRGRGDQLHIECPDDWPYENFYYENRYRYWSDYDQRYKEVHTGGSRIRVVYEAGKNEAPPLMVVEAVKHLTGSLFAVRNSHLTDEDGVTGMARANPVTMRLLRPYIVKTLFVRDTSTPV